MGGKAGYPERSAYAEQRPWRILSVHRSTKNVCSEDGLRLPIRLVVAAVTYYCRHEVSLVCD